MKNLCEVGRVQFPEPSGIVINMMPFVIGDHRSIPVEYHGYFPLIDACQVEQGQIGRIGYLSIQETAVSAERPSQRRPDIHTDKHPSYDWGGGWGKGRTENGQRQGGIYLASTVTGSCRAWDIHIATPGPLGDCEHLRETLEASPACVLHCDVLYWMTDSCPHESLPLAPGTFRQWFRFVTSEVDLWYARHSTVNRLGVAPPCRIVQSDKFAEAA